MGQQDTEDDCPGNNGFSSGPTGTRTRDLRIKRPSAKRALRSENPEAASHAGSAPQHTGGTLETGSATSALKIGARVRIVAGSAIGKVGVVIAEYVPLKPKAWRMWTVKVDDPTDLVGRREIRHDYLEVVS